ncbi:MAG: hypothetical protein ACOCWQ_05875 [Nanoarchaeota archaeon]
MTQAQQYCSEFVEHAADDIFRWFSSVYAVMTKAEVWQDSSFASVRHIPQDLQQWKHNRREYRSASMSLPLWRSLAADVNDMLKVAALSMKTADMVRKKVPDTNSVYETGRRQVIPYLENLRDVCRHMVQQRQVFDTVSYPDKTFVVTQKSRIRTHQHTVRLDLRVEANPHDKYNGVSIQEVVHKYIEEKSASGGAWDAQWADECRRMPFERILEDIAAKVRATLKEVFRRVPLVLPQQDVTLKLSILPASRMSKNPGVHTMGYYEARSTASMLFISLSLNIYLFHYMMGNGALTPIPKQLYGYKTIVHELVHGFDELLKKDSHLYQNDIDGQGLPGVAHDVNMMLNLLKAEGISRITEFFAGHTYRDIGGFSFPVIAPDPLKYLQRFHGALYIACYNEALFPQMKAQIKKGATYYVAGAMLNLMLVSDMLKNTIAFYKVDDLDCAKDDYIARQHHAHIPETWTKVEVSALLSQADNPGILCIFSPDRLKAIYSALLRIRRMSKPKYFRRLRKALQKYGAQWFLNMRPQDRHARMPEKALIDYLQKLGFSVSMPKSAAGIRSSG